MKTAKILIADGHMVKVQCQTPLVGMVPVIERLGYKFTGFNKNPYCRSELRDIPLFSGLCGPMWDGGNIRYETQEAYNLAF